MRSDYTTEVPEHSLVTWRTRTDDAFAPGFVHEGAVWPLDGIDGIDGDVVAAAVLANDSGIDELVSRVTGNGASTVALTDIELGPPVLRPSKILCLGLNYQAHADGAGFEVPAVPVFFAKFQNGLVGADANVVLPRADDKVDYEGELAVVIGKRAKQVSREDALDYVAGYAVFNDVSARDLQLATSQWTHGKGVDTFAPMGPGLVPAALIPDPQNLQLTTKLNDDVKQHDTTGSMVFGVAQTIEFISEVMTLEPGDIIATGTPAGVVFEQQEQRWLVDGDVMAVTIEGLGTLRNPTVREAAPAAAARESAASSAV
ncbi:MULTISPECIES: fumarylacetoacetate hydrolase family protein [Microbacterium]|uniref:fumarylacetoacetate hydrolase family protein n=1 Tax=Microbacterium TaxID=33882 RepID=UPI000D65E0B9|nr:MULTISPECIES: fumarylacetoacetate hydrolase family protein [Microbacterium]